MLLEWIELPGSQLDALAGFYGNALGLPVAWDGEVVVVTVGASRLRFIPSDTAAPFHFAFNVPSAQFAEAVAWLEARVPLIPFEDGGTVGHFESWNADVTYFRDPAGHIGELIARHEPPMSGLGPFGPASLLEISEIGLAVEDVIAAAQQLEAVGVPPYRCGPDPSFMSVGDAHGLFIVVSAGRLWFPDRITPAPAQSLRVGFRQGDRRFTLTVDANGALSLA